MRALQVHSLVRAFRDFEQRPQLTPPEPTPDLKNCERIVCGDLLHCNRKLTSLVLSIWTFTGQVTKKLMIA